MVYYVYILRSQLDGTYYRGSTRDYLKRFEEHNKGLSRYTRYKVPCDLVYVEEHVDKSAALIRERKLKRCNSDYLLWLIDQPSNILLR